MFKPLYVDVILSYAHSIVISRRPTMRVTTTGTWQAAPLTYRIWNRILGTIVLPGRLKFASYVPVKNVLILPVDRLVDRPVEPTGHRSGRVMKISTGSISEPPTFSRKHRQTPTDLEKSDTVTTLELGAISIDVTMHNLLDVILTIHSVTL